MSENDNYYEELGVEPGADQLGRAQGRELGHRVGHRPVERLHGVGERVHRASGELRRR